MHARERRFPTRVPVNLTAVNRARVRVLALRPGYQACFTYAKAAYGQPRPTPRRRKTQTDPLPSVVEGSIGSAVDIRATVGWQDVWAVVKASAQRRLGKPLLVAYLVLALVGLTVVAVSIAVMHF